jgi:hypothetical protein
MSQNAPPCPVGSGQREGCRRLAGIRSDRYLHVIETGDHFDATTKVRRNGNTREIISGEESMPSRRIVEGPTTSKLQSLDIKRLYLDVKPVDMIGS